MFIQAEQHMTITAINPDQITTRQHSQDSTIFHLSPTMNQALHPQTNPNFTSTPAGKDVRLQRLEMLQDSLKNEATSSNDPRSRAYATLHERTINPELRSRDFLDIPVTRQGLMGGRGESSSYAINEKREEISQAQQRLDSLEEDLERAQSVYENADEAERSQYFFEIIDLNSRIGTAASNLSSLQNQLSQMLRDA